MLQQLKAFFSPSWLIPRVLFLECRLKKTSKQAKKYHEWASFLKDTSDERHGKNAIILDQLYGANAEIEKKDTKIKSLEKKLEKADAALSATVVERDGLRDSLHSKIDQHATSLSSIMRLDEENRKLRNELDVALDQIEILKKSGTFYDTQNKVLQKVAESMLATLSGYETRDHSATQGSGSDEHA